MLSPRLGVVITTVIVAVLSVSAVAAQAETVVLQLKLGRGEVIYENTSATLKLTVKADSVRQEITLQSQARRAIRTLNVDPDGTMLVEMALEEYRITTGGRPQEPIKPPALFKVRPDGEIVEREIGAESLGVFPLPLPDRPVAVGDSWTRQTTFEEAGVIATGPITVTLRRIERVAGDRIAQLHIRMVGTITGAAGVIKTAPGTKAKVSGTARADGTVPYSVDRGRPLGGAATLSMAISVEVTAEGQSAAATVAVAGTTADKPISLTQLKPPAISPELLIVPGKSIGVVNLDQPVAEIAAKLGTPAKEAGFGQQTTLLTWPTRLRGHVDVGDATRFVGLAITDRAYRTEKGIGVGSSQGAVMMAYGMRPTQLDLKDAHGGSIRMLIYNDLGIAFAITSDQAHAELTPTQAPVGAVDSIIIFMPGGAAKIFPIP